MYTPPPKALFNGKPGPVPVAETLKQFQPKPEMDADKLKNDRIARCVALNCAAQITEAYAHIISATNMVKTMSEPEIKGWLKSLKQTEYADNLKVLTGEEPEIPF